MSRSRILVIALALAFAGMQMASMAAAESPHGHDGLAGKACQICHAAHLSALAPLPAIVVPAPSPVTIHAPEERASRHIAPERSSGVTRAPPASL